MTDGAIGLIAGACFVLLIFGMGKTLDGILGVIARYVDKKADAAADAAKLAANGTRTFAAKWIPRSEDVEKIDAALPDHRKRVSA